MTSLAKKHETGVKVLCNACLIGKFMKWLYERVYYVINSLTTLIYFFLFLLQLSGFVQFVKNYAFFGVADYSKISSTCFSNEYAVQRCTFKTFRKANNFVFGYKSKLVIVMYVLSINV